MVTIVSDQDIRNGSPRLDGTRITVLDVKRRVIDQAEDPHIVAGEYGLSMEQLFYALTHYYRNRSAFEAREQEASAMQSEGERASRRLLEQLERSGDEAGERAD